jgi:formate dehydrogenase subunit gamma
MHRSQRIGRRKSMQQVLSKAPDAHGMKTKIDAERLASSVATAVARHKDAAGAMLPILHDVQDALGFIPADAVPLIALALNVSRAEVHGVISYYHHFRQEPAGQHVLQVCRAEACQARGAEALIAHVKSDLGCDFHQTSADGRYTLEPAYCLGLCSSGPNLMLDDDLHAAVSDAKFDRIIARKNAVSGGGV